MRTSPPMISAVAKMFGQTGETATRLSPAPIAISMAIIIAFIPAEVMAMRSSAISTPQCFR